MTLARTILSRSMKCTVATYSRKLSSELTTTESSDARWLALRGESIFITGGSGLFGRWFVNALLDANQRLGVDIKATILTRNPEALFLNSPDDYKDSALTLLQGDVQDFTFPPESYSHILHMATTSAHETFAGEDPLEKFHMLVKGTERVLKFAGTCGARKVLFTSSGVAYGAYPDEMQRVPESYQGAPISTDSASALAQGKRAAEFLCSYYAQKYQFDYTVARCFSFIGPELPIDIHYAIGNFIRDALYTPVITVKGDGTPMRSFLYLSDLVHWLLALLVDGRSETIYNVGSDQAISILDLAYLVRDIIAPNKEIVVLGNSDHNIGNFGRNWYVPDTNLARTELNLEVQISLQDAIIKTANYLNH